MDYSEVEVEYKWSTHSWSLASHPPWVDHIFRIGRISSAGHTMGFVRLWSETEQTKMDIYYVFEGSSRPSHKFRCLFGAYVSLLFKEKIFSSFFYVYFTNMKALFILALQMLRFDLHLCLNVKVYKGKVTSLVPSFLSLLKVLSIVSHHTKRFVLA